MRKTVIVRLHPGGRHVTTIEPPLTICTCTTCPRCLGRTVCARCGRCARCIDHAPGCTGCPVPPGGAWSPRCLPLWKEAA